MQHIKVDSGGFDSCTCKVMARGRAPPPLAEAGDDDPRNGIALTPDMHWAMDRHLIAPGPDLRWHVSARLDRRIPDFERLCSLEGRELLLPTEPRLYPKREALAWRVGRLDPPTGR